MAAIPVIADIRAVYGPIAAQADKYIFAQIVGINITECAVRAPVIAHCEMVSGPDYSVTYPVGPVMIHVHMVRPVSD